MVEEEEEEMKPTMIRRTRRVREKGNDPTNSASLTLYNKEQDNTQRTTITTEHSTTVHNTIEHENVNILSSGPRPVLQI